MNKSLNHIFVIMLLLIVVISVGTGCGKKDNAGTESFNKPLDQSSSGELVTAIAEATTEEELTQAVEDIVSRGFSLGLVDADGKQLNPNVPENAISLSPISVATYAMMDTGGHFRTIEYVVGFLADAGVVLESTGALITVEDFLPDLQTYINWSFAHPDDPASAMGMVIASGLDMTVPDSPPTITGQTLISPLASLFIMGDVLIGIDGGNEEPIAAKSNWFVKKAFADTSGDEVVQRIRGLITTVNPLLSLIGSRLPGKALAILAAFEACDRLSVRMWEVPATLMGGENWVNRVSATLPIAKNLKLEKDKKESITVIGGVGIMSGVSGVPLETLEGVQTSYSFRLMSNEQMGPGFPLFDDADADLKSLDNVVVQGLTYSSSLNGQQLTVEGKGNAPYKLDIKKMSNPQTRKAILHASARITAPEDLRNIMKEKIDALKLNILLEAVVSTVVDKLPWDEIKETMALLNRDFQPTPWMCIVEFGPVEKKETPTPAQTTGPKPSPPEVRITSPKDGAIFQLGEPIVLSVTATDYLGKPLEEKWLADNAHWKCNDIEYFSCSPLGNSDFQVSEKLDKGTYKFTVTISVYYGKNVGSFESSDYVNIKVVPEQLSPLETLFKKKIWSMEMIFDDPQIKPQSDYEMTFQEGGTFAFLNTSWEGTWSGDGSTIKMEFSYDYKSGPNMIRRWEFTGTLMLAQDGDYRNAVLKGEFKQCNEWEKDKSMKTGTWTAE